MFAQRDAGEGIPLPRSPQPYSTRCISPGESGERHAESPSRPSIVWLRSPGTYSLFTINYDFQSPLTSTMWSRSLSLPLHSPFVQSTLTSLYFWFRTETQRPPSFRVPPLDFLPTPRLLPQSWPPSSSPPPNSQPRS